MVREDARKADQELRRALEEERKYEDDKKGGEITEVDV
jgi:hypothetical protein